MRLLVLSFYFAPDLGAGSFRTTALVEALHSLLPAVSTIDVVTTLPNRYASFKATAPALERKGRLTVRRIPLPVHRSGFIDQSWAFQAYARGVLAHAADQAYDVVFATSSRLMTAVLGALVARLKRARLYLDLRDIFADTVQEVLPRHSLWLAGRAFSWLERWAVSRADKVNLVSSGFRGYFSSRYPEKRLSFLTNGVDDEFTDVATAAGGIGRQAGPLRVLYAGNIGDGQALHSILPGLARRMYGRAVFRVFGDGGRKSALEAALAASGADNVSLYPPVRRERLVAEYRQADVLFLHLNDLAAFKKVLPSKVFEYAAVGKPVWAGVSGYAAEFLEREVSNSAVFAPCDADQAEEAFSLLDIRNTPRPDFVARYARRKIAAEMARDIAGLAFGGACCESW